MKLSITKGTDNTDFITFYLEEHNNISSFKIEVELITFNGGL